MILGNTSELTVVFFVNYLPETEERSGPKPFFKTLYIGITVSSCTELYIKMTSIETVRRLLTSRATAGKETYKVTFSLRGKVLKNG